MLKVNFDASIKNNQAAAGFVIRDDVGRLVRAGGKSLLPSSVPVAKFTAAWLGLKVVMQECSAEQIWLEGIPL